MKKRIVILGSTNVDLVSVMEDIPTSGETIIGSEFALHMGGKGANQALMAARAGAKVSFISGVGDDDFGKSALKNLSENGVDISAVTNFPGSTGVASIWVDQRGENRIVLNPGANQKLDTATVLKELGNLSDIGYLIAQLEIPLDVVIAAFEAAKSIGAVTILNPAPFQALPKRLLDATDWLIVNEIEFSGLHPKNSFPISDKEIREIEMQNLVITLGAEGAILVTERIKRVPAPATKAIDTTGAGDCLVGSFAAALSLGLDIEVALRFGITCASESVSSLGAQSSYPSPERAREILRSLAPDSL